MKTRYNLLLLFSGDTTVYIAVYIIAFRLFQQNNTLAWSVVCCDVVKVYTRVLCLFTVDGAVTKLQ